MRHHHVRTGLTRALSSRNVVDWVPKSMKMDDICSTNTFLELAPRLPMQRTKGFGWRNKDRPRQSAQSFEQHLLIAIAKKWRGNYLGRMSKFVSLPHKILDDDWRPASTRMHIGNDV